MNAQQDSGWARLDEIPEADSSSSEVMEPLPKAEPWFGLARERDAADTELIKHRFLCRGGGLLLVGQTGVGKSSFSRQMALHFAVGKPFVGLEPVCPLRVLIIQAENDDRDEAEICQGIVLGSGFTNEQVQSAGPFILHYREQTRSGLEFFSSTVAPLIEQVKPDLVIIDPLLAYLGCDQNSQREVGQWLRHWLNPLLAKHNCAAILVHHTNKVSLKAIKEGWSPGDFGYLGAGSAEFANWSRAILCLVPTVTPGLYALHAPKRGMRLHWRDTAGGGTTNKIVAHSREKGQIHWSEARNEQGGPLVVNPFTNRKRIPTVDEFVTLFPALGGTASPRACLFSAGDVRNAFLARGWNRDSYAGVCDQAVRQGALKLLQEGRGNRRKLYGRPEAVEAYRAEKNPKEGARGDEAA